MWPSLDKAVSIFDFANVLLIGALIAGVIATFLVVWMGNVKEKYSSLELAAMKEEAAIANERAAELERQSEELRTTAGLAKAEAAKANESAQVARLKTEQLKAQVAWRQVTPETASKLKHLLSLHPGSVNLRYIDGDTESLYLAAQFKDILEAANWKVAVASIKAGSELIFGTALPDDGLDDGILLRNSFVKCGITFDVSLPAPGIVLLFNANSIPGAPTLLIGSKRPAAF